MVYICGLDLVFLLIQLKLKLKCAICVGEGRASAHNVMVDYFTFQLVSHDWYNKGYCMCYPVCGMVHIKDSLQ